MLAALGKFARAAASKQRPSRLPKGAVLTTVLICGATAVVPIPPRGPRPAFRGRLEAALPQANCLSCIHTLQAAFYALLTVRRGVRARVSAWIHQLDSPPLKRLEVGFYCFMQ